MKSKLLLVSLLSTALSAMTAGAIPMEIGGLVSRSAYNTITGSNGNSPANNLTFLNYQISQPGDAFVMPNWALQISSDLNPTGSTAALPVGDSYAVVYFSGQGGGSYQAYYLGGTGGTITAPTGYSIGSIRTVPDGGSTVMLLGAALSAIAVARRKFGV